MALDDLTYVPEGYDELVKYGFTDKNGYPACPNNSRGDGGIHSCLTDMVAFDRALFGGKLISEKSMEILLNDDDTGYCCGLRKNSQGYSHDGSSFTCSGNNKIIESEEYGHVYVITLVYTGQPKQSDDAADAVPEQLSGTNYKKGVYENGVYVNDYAEIKLNIPSDCKQTSEGDIERTENFRLSLCTEEKDKLLISADKIDSYFESGSYSISIDFVNSILGIPHNPDCTEDEYLDVAKEFLTGPGTPPYAEFEYEERQKVDLGNKEYWRDVCSVSADGIHQYYYDYARRIDDDLICIIEINGNSDHSPEYFEQLFGAYEGLSAAADEDDPMSGTNYTKGVFKDGVYVNSYAGLILNVPEGFSPMSDSNMKMSHNNSLSDLTDDRDITREKATAWDIVLIGYEDIIEIDFLNTKLGVPDDTDYTADEYLDDYEDLELRMVPGYMKPQVSQDRSTAELSGKEYLRNLVVLTDSGEKGNNYIYVRKLDDDLMCIISIAIWSEKTAEDYELLFLNDEAASSAA